jgi:hypothetical protein
MQSSTIKDMAKVVHTEIMQAKARKNNLRAQRQD